MVSLEKFRFWKNKVDRSTVVHGPDLPHTPTASMVGQPLILNVPRGDARSIARWLSRIAHLRQAANQPRNENRKQVMLDEAKKFEQQLAYVPNLKIPENPADIEKLINKVLDLKSLGGEKV